MGNILGEFDLGEPVEIDIDLCEQHCDRPIDLNHLNKIIAGIAQSDECKPIMVRIKASLLPYKIIDGNYRHEAMKRLGKKTIPAWVLSNGQNRFN